MRALRWLLLAAMILAGDPLWACPLCANARQLTISAQELIYAAHSVLALPDSERNEFHVVAVIKGDPPPGNTITGAVFKADAAAMRSEKPLLLIRDDAWLSWVNFGSVNVNQAGWLRQLSITERTIGITDGEWRDHVAYFLPYLENPEPMLAEIAFNEFVDAPYGALRSLKPRLDAKAIRAWLHDPKLTAREPVYLLLLGVAGTAEDAAWIEQRLEFARKKHDTTNLPALIGADLELRGPAGVAQIEKLYLTDPSRTKPESEAAATALQTWRETTKPQRVAFNAK